MSTTTLQYLEIDLGNLSCSSFILSTILSSGGRFESATKLQKLAFLSIYENGLEHFTDFKWHHYGPFSKELQDTVSMLSNEDLIVEESINRTSYSGKPYTITRLSLTPRGYEMAKKAMEEITAKNKKALFETMDKYSCKPLSKILEYVYNAYNPEDL